MNFKNRNVSTFTLDNVQFKIAEKVLLHPQNITFPAGKFSALIGHNGSGKSTLLKLLGRHLSSTSGKIMLNKTSISEWSAKEFAREVAYLPQQLPLAEGLTVRELVSLGRYPWHGALGRFSAHDHRIVDEAIDATDLNILADRIVDSLSGGEKQRAWIAMLIAQNSRCLLLDEPTSALDLAHQSDILLLLQKVSRERGITVIAVLHDINMAARHCDYIYALRSGKMIAQGNSTDIMNASVLMDIYGLPMGVFKHPLNGIPVSYIH